VFLCSDLWVIICVRCFVVAFGSLFLGDCICWGEFVVVCCCGFVGLGFGLIAFFGGLCYSCVFLFFFSFLG